MHTKSRGRGGGGYESLSPFGVALRNMRVSRGWLLANLADELAVSPSYISQLETGSKMVPDGFVDRIAKVMDLDDNEVAEIQQAVRLSAREYKFAIKKGTPADDRAFAHLLTGQFARLTTEQKRQIEKIVKEG